jgi:small subunit ribosomal protein S3Ae
MAIGKSKKVGKKKGGKKVIDPMLKKEWYDFKAPAPFTKRTFGKTLVTRTTGTRIASDRLKGRVVEVTLGDLNEKQESNSWRKVKLCIEEVQGRNCMTNFHGLDMTRDKLCQFVRKWHSLIEAHCEVKTLDGYILRIFCIGFTQRLADHQKRKTSYAQRSQVKQIRKKMIDVITKEVSKANMVDVLSNLITENIGEEIKTACKFIYPLTNVYVRKVKTVKKPKFDVTKLNELYKEAPAEAKGAKTEGAEGGDDAAKNLLYK